MGQALIISGMHRSGTSLIAGMLAQAGVDLGDRLVPPASDNPLGFFEDADFVAFHESCLSARGETLLVTRPFEFIPTAAENTSANQLIAARSGRELWGWKDPRTCLFLDFWREHLPDARFLFVYRPPLEVLMSLVRRGQFRDLGLMDGLAAWRVYNTQVAAFCARYPERTFLCSTHESVEHIAEFNGLLKQKFDLCLELGPTAGEEFYRPEYLRRLPPWRELGQLVQLIDPDAIELHTRLDEQADLPSTPREPEPAPASVRALLDFARALPAPLSSADKRSLVVLLAFQLEPDALEKFFGETVATAKHNEQEAQAWEEKAEEREQALREQTAWVEPRMRYLRELEASLPVRWLTRLGLLPKSDAGGS